MRRIVKGTGIVVAALIVIVISLPFLINVDQFRPTLQSEISRGLGREVTLGHLRLKILSGEVTADDLSVAEDPAFGKPAFLRAKSLQVGVELWPFLLSRKMIVTNLSLDQPEIALVQSPKGDWNFSSLGAKTATPATPTSSATAPLDLSVKLIRVTNGQLTLGRTIGHWKPLVLDQVNIEMRDFSKDASFPLSLWARVRGGGTIKLEGKAGPIHPTDSAMTPVTVSLAADQLDLASTGLNDFMPELAGLVSLDGNADSDGTTISLKGRVKVDKLTLAKSGRAAQRTVELDFAIKHDLRKHSGTLAQGDVHIGNALAHLTGTYTEQGAAVTLNMKLDGPAMPVQELAALLPPLGIVLPNGASLQGGAATANLTIEGPAPRLITKGSLAVNGTRLAGFDLPKKMTAIEALAGIHPTTDTEIQTLSANVESSPEGIQAHDLRLVVPSIGDLSGNGTVSPANVLDFKMSAVVHTSGLLTAVGNQPIPFSIGGTCTDPTFRPDVKSMVKQEIRGAAGKAASELLKGLTSGGKKN
jgi:AsmA protein